MADFRYFAPDYASGLGATAEFEQLRQNMWWVMCCALHKGTTHEACMIPGGDTTITYGGGGPPEYTQIEWVWNMTADVLKFRLTPTWSSGQITAMQFEMDTGAGYSVLSNIFGQVNPRSFAPVYHPEVPDPRASSTEETAKNNNVQEDMDDVKDNMLALMTAAALQSTTVISPAPESRLPGYTTTQNVVSETEVEIQIADSAGPGDTPRMIFRVSRDSSVAENDGIQIEYERENAAGLHTVAQHTILLEPAGGSGSRIASQDVVAP